MSHYVIVELSESDGEAFRELVDAGWLDEAKVHVVFPQTWVEGLVHSHGRDLDDESGWSLAVPGPAGEKP